MARAAPCPPWSSAPCAGCSPATLPRYENAAPDRIWRHLLDAAGTVHIASDGVTCGAEPAQPPPVPIDAGFAGLRAHVPWRDGRTLRFRFPLPDRQIPGNLNSIA
jgi:hypothetical protein